MVSQCVRLGFSTASVFDVTLLYACISLKLAFMLLEGIVLLTLQINGTTLELVMKRLGLLTLVLLAGIVVLTLLINATTLEFVIRRLGLMESSRAEAEVWKGLS